MSTMREPLSVSFQGSFDREQSAGAPVIPMGQVGLLANASELGSGRGVMSFTLACSYKFPEPFVSSFVDVSHAINLIIEDPDTGRARTIDLEDPTLIFYPQSTPNFLASRAAGNPQVLMGGWVKALVEVGGFTGRKPLPTLYARLALQTHVSPLLELRFSNRRVAAFLDGKPHSFELYSPPPD